ncbi:hypothetical protein PHMEG_00030321 [Phytophthora megakarya]|uniref:Uncharacterized protein n=1 Tax=Phytophthora megakarya TaxID=4795 RepID=A0A225V0S3_9STRA|nr:hypothetical protein PHMEG_00030321 [Phytophthora megakarya]
MDEDVAPTVVRSVLKYTAATTTPPEPAPEERELQPDEKQRYFPVVDVNQDEEETRALEWKIL